MGKWQLHSLQGLGIDGEGGWFGGRGAIGDDGELVKRQRRHRDCCDGDMPNMNWIKGAAEYANPLQCLIPRALVRRLG